MLASSFFATVNFVHQSRARFRHTLCTPIERQVQPHRLLMLWHHLSLNYFARCGTHRDSFFSGLISSSWLELSNSIGVGVSSGFGVGEVVWIAYDFSLMQGVFHTGAHLSCLSDLSGHIRLIFGQTRQSKEDLDLSSHSCVKKLRHHLWFWHLLSSGFGRRLHNNRSELLDEGSAF